MGITIWWPKPAAAAPGARGGPGRRGGGRGGPGGGPLAAAVHPATPPAPTAAPTPIAPAVAAAAPAPQPRAPGGARPSGRGRTGHRLAHGPGREAYPQAGGGSADDGWLVIWEGPHPAAPLTGDSGKLLDNMLAPCACTTAPMSGSPGSSAPGTEALSAAGLAAEAVNWQPLDQSLSHCLQHTRPARVLVLGLHAARAVLGSEEALGRLRAQVHPLHGTPAVVGYHPAYLLRSTARRSRPPGPICAAPTRCAPPAP